MNRELLEKTFSPDQIKQREGNFGIKLDYIEGHNVIHRLNDAFEAEWSFSILKHEIPKQHCLQILWISYRQAGCRQECRLNMLKS